MEPVILSQRNDRVCCEIAAIPDWDGFEKVAKFLEKYYGARIRTRHDGPDARRWIIELDDGVVELHHEDPYGNRLLSMSASTDALVTRVAEDLRARLRTLGN